MAALFTENPHAFIHRLLCLNTLMLVLALSLLNSLTTSATVSSRVSVCQSSNAVVAALRAQNQALMQHRIAYGELYCQLHGVGPTGGFCVNGTSDVGGNNYWDKSLCSKLAELFAGKSVLDLGCGLGHYGRCLQAAGTGVRWLGVDGSEGIERATDGFVKFMDLSMPQQLDQQYDWVMSLEVAEHLPAKYEQVLLGNVARHAKEGIVLTWAIPGQGGHHHVNERSNDYVIQRMAQLGFKYDHVQSQAFRNAAEPLWFKQTFMIFRRV